MITSFNTTNLAADCRAALNKFWDEQLAVETTDSGVVVALPLMYPDGLQVVVNIEQLAPKVAVITDHGRTLGQLRQSGYNIGPAAKHARELLDERLKSFELQQSGLELRKEIRLPIDGLDVHLFGEALVSIAHLIYRHEPETHLESTAMRTVRDVFNHRHLEPEQNVFLEGSLANRIKVDFLQVGAKRLALQVIKRRGGDQSYLEQWAWRWSDLRKHNENLLRAMIYDPTLQQFDATALRIGESACELFCPYFETDRIDDLIAQTM
jgi:hypothetical protein